MKYSDKTILIFITFFSLLLFTQCGIIGSDDDTELVGHWLWVSTESVRGEGVTTRDNAENEWVLFFDSDSTVISKSMLGKSPDPSDLWSKYEILYEQTWSENDSANVIYMLNSRFVIGIEGNTLHLKELCSYCSKFTFVKVYGLFSQ